MAAAAGGVGLSRARTWWWLIDGSETARSESRRGDPRHTNTAMIYRGGWGSIFRGGWGSIFSGDASTRTARENGFIGAVRRKNRLWLIHFQWRSMLRTAPYTPSPGTVHLTQRP